MLLRCESLEPSMSRLGHELPKGDVRVESVLPPTSTLVGAVGTAASCQTGCEQPQRTNSLFDDLVGAGE